MNAQRVPVNPPLSSEEDYYGSFDNEFHNFWTNGSYYCIFAGMGFLPDRPLGRLAYRPEAVEKSRQIFRRIQLQQQELLQSLPSNFEYLQKFHAARRSADQSPVAAKAAVRLQA